MSDSGALLGVAYPPDDDKDQPDKDDETAAPDKEKDDE